MLPESPPTGKKKCPKCGNSFTAASVFCKNCGTRLTEQQNAPNFSHQDLGITTLPYAMFRANLQHTGEYDNGGVEPPNVLLWRFKTGNDIGFSSPAVANDVVYIGSSDFSLYAIDTMTGAEKWRFDTTNRLSSSPAVANGVVYVGSDDKNLYAIDAITGKEKWRFNTGGWGREEEMLISSSPAVADGVVYVGSLDNNLYAIDTITGKEKWRFGTRGNVFSSPAVADGVVYVGSRDKTLYAIDTITGKEKWRFETGGWIDSSPAVADGVVYVRSRDKTLYAIDTITGKEKWRFKTGRSWVYRLFINSSPAVTDGIVYVGSLDNNLYAIDAITGKEKWRFAAGGWIASSPAVANKVVYVGSGDRNLYAIDAVTGKEKWRFETKYHVQSSPAVSNGVVYFGSGDSHLYAIGEKDKTKLRKNASSHKNADSENLSAPYLALTLETTQFAADQWHRVPIHITNTGIADALEVTFTFTDEFETRWIKPVNIEAGNTSDIIIGLRPKQKGNIPLEIQVLYKDIQNKKYKQSFEYWTEVSDSPSAASLKTPPPLTTPKPSTTRHPPSDLTDRYTDWEYIGKGGFARVFKAKRKDGKFVAVKIPLSMDEATGKSFIAEMQHWTKLSHPNIVKLYDFNIMPMPYFEEELCDSALADQSKPIEIEKAAWILFNICEGLKFAHARKIIHRDLKPQNILLVNGVPKISDWGLSRIISESTSTTVTSFTPYYAAPEQIGNKAKDERTDIWQLGVILYELVTGVLPFKGDSMIEIGMNIATKDPIPPGELKPDAKIIDAIVMKCLQKDPVKRYPSVLEMQKDIARYLGQNYGELLKTSVSVQDFSRSAAYCGDLVMINIHTGDIATAYKFLLDFIQYSKGDVRAEAQELSEQLKMRMEIGITEIPDELIRKAEIIVHQVSLGFRGKE